MTRSARTGSLPPFCPPLRNGRTRRRPTTNFSRRLLLLLVMMTLTAVADDDLIALASKTATRAEAERRLLLMPNESRRPLLKRLLTQRFPTCRQAAIRVAHETWDLTLLPELQAALAKERQPVLRPQFEACIRQLEAYRPIAIEYDPGRASTTPSDSNLFRPATVRLTAQNLNGQSVTGAQVIAYADDYGVVVTGRESAPLDLFPGRWTFFASAPLSGGGLYLCEPGTVITSDTNITLRATRSLTVECPASTEEVKVVDSAFAQYFRPSASNEVVNGRCVLQVSRQRPVDVIAIRQPQGGHGHVLFAKGVTNNTTLGTANCGALRFTGNGVTRAEVGLTVSCFDAPEAALQGDLPFEVRVSPGFVEFAYSYTTGTGHTLSFERRGCQLAGGKQLHFVLGGPYQCSVFHQLYRQHGQGPGRQNILAYYLFVRDANGGYLESCRRDRTLPTVPVEIFLGERKLFSSTETKPTRQLMSEAGSIDPKTDLAALRYRVTLPFEPAAAPCELAGHGTEFKKEGTHFWFEGPPEMSEYAAHWLAGAEAVYDAFAGLLGRQTSARERNQKQGIRIHVKMPPGVGAYASGGNVTFPVRYGFSVSRTERILTVPMLHEVLHTFGHGHQDFMPVSCEEAAVRLLGGSPAARRQKSGPQDELRRCLRGEQARTPDTIVPQVLRARFGYDLFLRYVAIGKPKREALRTLGLTEMEADCAIFDALTDGQARPIYRAAGAVLNEANLDKGVAFMAGKDTLPTSTSPAVDKTAVNRAVNSFRAALEKKDTESALKQLERLRTMIPQVGDFRFQADKFLTVGQLLFMHDQKTLAYEALKDCQRAATHVNAAYVNTARRLCMDVLAGKPTRTLQ